MSTLLSDGQWLDTRESYPVGWNGFIPVFEPGPHTVEASQIIDEELYSRSGVEYRVRGTQDWIFHRFEPVDIDDELGIWITPPRDRATVVIDAREVIDGRVIANLPPVSFEVRGSLNDYVRLVSTTELDRDFSKWMHWKGQPFITFGGLTFQVDPELWREAFVETIDVHPHQTPLAGMQLVASVEIFAEQELIYQCVVWQEMTGRGGWSFTGYAYTFWGQTNFDTSAWEELPCELTAVITGMPGMAVADPDTTLAWDGQIELILRDEYCPEPDRGSGIWSSVSSRVIR